VALKADQLRSHSEGEVFTLSVVAYALMMATFTEENQVSLEAGALFAGIAVMKSPHIDKILTSIRPITSVFGGMYITAMGMIISPIFVANNLFTILLLAVMIGGMKMGVASVLLTKSYGYPLAVSSALCSSVAQISEGSLVVLAKAQRLGFVSRQTCVQEATASAKRSCCHPPASGGGLLGGARAKRAQRRCSTAAEAGRRGGWRGVREASATKECPSAAEAGEREEGASFLRWKHACYVLLRKRAASLGGCRGETLRPVWSRAAAHAPPPPLPLALTASLAGT
jgi:Kef-type K+ transport system membrane component KefB